MTNLDLLINEYLRIYPHKSSSFIAGCILDAENIQCSHSTLRQKIGRYRKSNDFILGTREIEEISEPKRWEEFVTAPIDTFDVDHTYVGPSETSKHRTSLEPYEGGDPNNVLVIGDIHEPFCREGYLEHCRTVQENTNCGSVVFIGDVIDSHYSSFHPSDPDGYGAGEELDRAIDKLGEWHRVFPNAKVTLGNHDLIINRQAFKSGLSKRWIKGLDEVLGTPSWEYDTEFEINGVLYTHQLGSDLMKAAVNRRQSIVAGHIHTKAGIDYNVSKKDILFAMQVGCGIDDTAYAFAYAKLNTKKSIISCGVVLGELPIVIPMTL